MASKRPKLHGDLSAAACPSRSVLDHVTSRWGTLVMVVLRDGTHRFGELRQRIGGVSDKMLTQTLAVLEADGFVIRNAFAEIPPRVEYSLTPMGRELAVHVAALGHWVETNLGRVLTARAAHTPRAKAAARTR